MTRRRRPPRCAGDVPSRIDAFYPVGFCWVCGRWQFMAGRGFALLPHPALDPDALPDLT